MSYFNRFLFFQFWKKLKPCIIIKLFLAKAKKNLI